MPVVSTSFVELIDQAGFAALAEATGDMVHVIHDLTACVARRVAHSGYVKSDLLI